MPGNASSASVCNRYFEASRRRPISALARIASARWRHASNCVSCIRPPLMACDFYRVGEQFLQSSDRNPALTA
jgi:hypothetical protein